MTRLPDLEAWAVFASLGLALQAEFLVWKHLNDGTLETMMPDWFAPHVAQRP